MTRHGRLTFLLSAVITACMIASSFAAQDSKDDRQAKVRTAIVVKDMHCTNCAKKIARKLYSVKGVKGVRAVVKTNTATVTPEKGKQPSPKALWEAVEAAGFKPVKLAGPLGTYKQKPKK